MLLNTEFIEILLNFYRQERWRKMRNFASPIVWTKMMTKKWIEIK